MTDQEIRLYDEESRSILNWISPLTFWAKQNDVLSRKQEGTCEWFFETPGFQSWLNGDEPTLWCPGIRKSIPWHSNTLAADVILAGAGKTVLAYVGIRYTLYNFVS